MMTDRQKEWTKQQMTHYGVQAGNKKNVEIPIYWEFDPRDYGGGDVDMSNVDFNRLKKRMDEITLEICGTTIDWGNFEVRKLQANASLFYIKSSAIVPNPFL